jgi:hypothetical protein
MTEYFSIQDESKFKIQSENYADTYKYLTIVSGYTERFITENDIKEKLQKFIEDNDIHENISVLLVYDLNLYYDHRNKKIVEDYNKNNIINSSGCIVFHCPDPTSQANWLYFAKKFIESVKYCMNFGTEHIKLTADGIAIRYGTESG